MVRLLSPVVSFGATKPTGSGKRFTKQKTNMLIDMKQRARQINEIEKCFTNNIFANMLLINRVNSLCIYSLFFSFFFCLLVQFEIKLNLFEYKMEYRNLYVHWPISDLILSKLFLSHSRSNKWFFSYPVL